MRIHTVDQRSPEWRQLRCGKVTGSKADAVLNGFLKGGGQNAARRDYLMQLACETITGVPQDSDFVNDDMRRGTELEPAARAAYESFTGTLVSDVGFVTDDVLAAGCSPDGVIGEWDGILELKVPRSATHLRYIRSGGLPAEHEAQILHALLITRAKFAEFVSFDPRMPDGLRLYVHRVMLNPVAVRTYEERLVRFLADLENEVSAIHTLANLPAVLLASAEVA